MNQYVYILREKNGRKTYVGYTIDLKRRLRQHNGEIKGGAKSTAGRNWEFAGYFTGFPDPKSALQCEWKIKHPSKKIGNGMKGRLNSLKEIFYLDKLTANSMPVKDLQLELFILEEYLPLELPENISIHKLELEGVLMKKSIEKGSQDSLEDCKN